MNEQSSGTLVPYASPIPTRNSKEAISAQAENFRRTHNIQSGFDLARLVTTMRGQVSEIGLFEDDQTAAVVVSPDDSFEISISPLTGPLRDNFTIAHELGHLILHWPLVKAVDPESGMKATRRVDSTNRELMRCEYEANWFAAALLMPAEEFTKTFQIGGQSYAARLFGVSEAAANVRAKNLDLTGF